LAIVDRLLHAETGTKIDLGAMPPEGVARCRAAWVRLIGRETCVVHGNPNNPGNVRVTANRVALIDWDESHVDVPDLDLVLPHNAAGLDGGAHDIAAQASAAWEAAVCWDDETQSSGLPKFERSEQPQRIERPHRTPDSPAPPLKRRDHLQPDSSSRDYS
jgi:aminoglycoside phosphotransferase (APT) family kinase protein